ncbi:MAG: hypothetical protein BHW64_03275 [Candidatus Melainabacteria bacterium LEY3_CP_29_8]|nr:MAG: hypothetical protein BHW64_03275 [Candidatus Melainabacteria bacterium LEY3_CP_29_8]
MEILDIKNDLARILYSPLNDKKLMLSDFLVVQDANEIIFAQIINIETSRYEDCNIAVLKFVLTYNPKTNSVMTYNGYVPSKSSELKYLNPVDIVKHIRKEEKVINWGNLLNTKVDLKTDLNILNDNFYIECDNKRSTQIINNNIIETLNELNEKVVVVDFESRFKNKCAKSIKLGEELKIPFNEDAFDYIIQNDIGLGAYENRIVVEGILLELQSYVKTLENRFLPFKTLEKVIEDEFCKTKLPEMGLFRNKLIKYSRQNLFAQYDSEISIINKYIEENNVTIVNTYRVDDNWKKLVLNSIVESIDTECYFVVILDDMNSNKKTLEKIYQNKNIKPILSTSYLYKENFYIKTSSSNGILFKQQQRSKDFATYSSFIHKLGLNEYIINGEATYDIPFILKLKKFDFERERMIDEQIKADVDSIMQRGSLTYFSNENYQNYKPLEKSSFDMKSFDERNIFEQNSNSIMDMTIEEAMNNAASQDIQMEPETQNLIKNEEIQKIKHDEKSDVQATTLEENHKIEENEHKNENETFIENNNISLEDEIVEENDFLIDNDDYQNEDEENDIIDSNMLNLLDVLEVNDNIPEETTISNEEDIEQEEKIFLT